MKKARSLLRSERFHRCPTAAIQLTPSLVYPLTPPPGLPVLGVAGLSHPQQLLQTLRTTMGLDRSERRAAVKGGINNEDCRKNRAQQKVELRKAKRDEGLQKRRNLNLVVIDPALEPDVEPEGSDASTPTGAPQQSFEELVQTAQRFIASNGAPEEFDAAFAATRALRKQLSLAKNPPIDEVIAAGRRGPRPTLAHSPFHPRPQSRRAPSPAPRAITLTVAVAVAATVVR